jgi:hypothetical protein
MAFRRIARDPPTYVVTGPTREELFENVGFVVFSEGWHLDGVKPTYSRPIVAPGDTYEELLRHWIDELLYVAEETGLAWAYFVVDRLEEGGVQGSAAGMPAASVRRRGRRLRGLSKLGGGLVPVREGWWVEVQLDVEEAQRDL